MRDTARARHVVSVSGLRRPVLQRSDGVFRPPFILAGAMGPIFAAAALVQQNAEALVGIARTPLVRPSVPVIYGGFTTNANMKMGNPAFGTPEGAWALWVGAQLARLPYRASGALAKSS